jgi:hypothetical protein
MINKVQTPRPLVLFSTGLDSTYLLECMLAFYGYCDVLFVKASQCPLGYAAESMRLNKIIDILEKETKGKVVCRYESDLGMFMNAPSYQTNTQQGLFWVNAALEIIHPDIHSMMVVGYVKEDNMHNNGKYLKEVFHSSQMYLMGKSVPAKFPMHGDVGLDDTDREYIIDKPTILNSINPLMLPHIWVCETPKLADDKIIPCKTCASCKQMKESLLIYKHRYGKDVSHRYFEATRSKCEPYWNRHKTVSTADRDAMWERLSKLESDKTKLETTDVYPKGD